MLQRVSAFVTQILGEIVVKERKDFAGLVLFHRKQRPTHWRAGILFLNISRIRFDVRENIELDLFLTRRQREHRAQFPVLIGDLLQRLAYKINIDVALDFKRAVGVLALPFLR